MGALITQPQPGDYRDAPTTQEDAGGVIPCPDPVCPAPAQVVDRFGLESTDGPIEHVNAHCLN
jgi:hypothetical protein